MDVNNLRHPSTVLKIAEVVLLVIILALYFSQIAILAEINFISTVFVGCFINALVLLTVRLLGYNQIQNTPLELILYSFYVVFLFTSAILLFTSSDSIFIATGVFSLLTTVIYSADWYYAFIGLNGHRPSLTPLQIPNQKTTSVQTPYQQTDSSQSYATIGIGSHVSYQQEQSPFAVDAAGPNQGINYQTNPMYPPTMNYPPTEPTP